MHITVISMCHKCILTNTAYHQNKSYSKSIRQYAKRRTTAQFPSVYYFIIITKCHQKLISHSGECLGAVTLWYNVKKCQNKLW